MNGGKFEKRNSYVYTRDGKNISNNAPDNLKLNQFFKFTK